MLHARFVIDNDIFVIFGKLIHGHGQILVGCTIAAGTVGLPHDHQVKAGFLNQGLMDFHLHELITAHPRRDITFDFLTDLAKRGGYVKIK